MIRIKKSVKVGVKKSVKKSVKVDVKKTINNFTIDDIYVYIFNWKKTNNNVIKIYDNVIKYKHNICIINSDENFKFDDNINVIQLNDNYYYGGQFENAIRNIQSNKILCIIVGDTKPDVDFENVFNNAVKAFNNYNAGIFAPNDLRTLHKKRNNQIKNTTLFHVPNTDYGFWFIHPILLEKLKDINYYQLGNFGWGVNAIVIEECKRNKLNILRDYSISVDQLDHTTNYNSKDAYIQLKNLLNVYHKKILSRT